MEFRAGELLQGKVKAEFSLKPGSATGSGTVLHLWDML